MLKSIKITNFLSIGEEQEISFEIKKSEVLDHSARELAGKNINLVNCIIGANASGKTTVLKAISFLFWFIDKSYEQKSSEGVPILPHALKKADPIRFEIEFFNLDSRYKYIVEIFEDKVIYEYLGEHVNRGYTRVFEYKRVGDDWDLELGNLKVPNAELERYKLRKSISVFSTFIAMGFLTGFSFLGRYGSNSGNGKFLVPTNDMSRSLQASKYIHDNKDILNGIVDFVGGIDLGISNLTPGRISIGMEDRHGRQESEEMPMLACVHKSSKGEFPLPLFLESAGTIGAIYLYSKVLKVLKKGGLLTMDEIETELHPDVVRKIISLFESKETNPNNAQLIFSTHQHVLLNDRTKTQIFLAEKDKETFETEIYRLDDIEDVRNDENYFKKYITGTYGAIPDINWLG